MHHPAHLVEEAQALAGLDVVPRADDGEEFERSPTTFTGIPELLDRYMLRLAADFDMPETELFRSAPQGLNATGENERKKWFDSLGGFQTTDIAPPLKRFYHLLSLAKDSPVKRKKSGSGNPARWTMNFRHYYTPTDKEEADTESRDGAAQSNT